jgi:hypothetical protein
MVVIVENSDPGSRIIPPKKYCDTDPSNMVEMDQDPKIYRTQQENFKKMLRKYEKSRFLIAWEHFSMGLLWGQLHRDFLRFAN